MGVGLRTELAVDRPENCPVAHLSGTTDHSVSNVEWTGNGDGPTVEEFQVRTGRPELEQEARVDVDRVLDLDSTRVYRFTRQQDASCACEAVEALGCPIADARAEDGTLLLTLHIDDTDTLREVIRRMEPVAASVEVRYLVRDNFTQDGSDVTVVDRNRLTTRQREVLRTAYELGYFRYPRETNASEVADELGISLSTFTEHLSTAQSKLLDELLQQ